jgi:hypothetical protein
MQSIIDTLQTELGMLRGSSNYPMFDRTVLQRRQEQPNQRKSRRRRFCSTDLLQIPD